MQTPRSSAQRAEQPPGHELANDPGENPCFGCGPDNIDGLRLRFFDDGEVVRAPIVLDERHQSWPGFANMGILFTGMLEAGGWAVWERLGPSRIASPFTVEQLGIPALGPTMIEARVDDERPQARVDVTALQGAKTVARGSWAARVGTPEEAAQMLALPQLPRSLRPGFQERAAQKRG